MMNNKLLFFLAVMLFSGLFIKSWSQKDKNDSLFKEIKMPVDEATKLITYTNVINVDAKKDSLYKKGLKWFNSYYKNPKGVIKTQNPEEGKISGKPQFKILNPPDKNGTPSMRGIIYYTITTFYKDGKCKYEITDINLEQASKYPVEKWLDKSSKSFSPVFNYFIKQIDDNIKTTVKSFENYMKASTASKNDAW
jgi:hypothetical protein